MISIFGNVGVNLHLEITSTREQAAEDWAGKAGEKAASSPLPIHALIAAKYPACLHSSSPNAPVKILYTSFSGKRPGEKSTKLTILNFTSAIFQRTSWRRWQKIHHKFPAIPHFNTDLLLATFPL